MRNLAARLAILACYAALMRAACGQPNQALRYPLPAGGPPQVAPEQVQGTLFQPGQIVARVGDKTILYGDVAPTVNLILATVPSAAERAALEAQRAALTQNAIQLAVQNKMLLMEFERGMPSEYRSDAKKRAEAEGKLRKSVRNSFDDALTRARERVAATAPNDLESAMQQDPTMMRLALLMKDRGLVSQGELDRALRELGTTLEQQAKEYGEMLMGMEAAKSKLGIGRNGKKPEVTHQEMLDYYQQHQADYQIPTKARFEILTARLSRFNGDRGATHNHVVMMGNEVLFGGTPFPAVAKKHSHEPNADAGGFYDWISPGSLASKPIDRAVFSLEVEKLSQIIEDDAGFHIIRVKERQPAGIVSFEEAQPGIRERIENQKRAAERQKYFTELRARTKIWTIYDTVAENAGGQGAATGVR